jgi:hypothetical protein
MKPLDWILGNDTGTSSETIWEVMTGQEIGHLNHRSPPSDEDDFGRCFRLLIHFPEWRPRLGEVAARHPMWAPLVRDWDKVEKLYLEYRGLEAGATKGRLWHTIHDLLSELQAEAVVAGGGKVHRCKDGRISGWEYDKDGVSSTKRGKVTFTGPGSAK